MSPERKTDPVLEEGQPNPLSPKYQAKLEKYLGKDERILWTAETRVITNETPVTSLAYVITDQRAFVIPSAEIGFRVMGWNEVNQVTITRRLNRNGKLSLTSVPSSGSDRFYTLQFKNCPQIERVQQIVERLLYGADSDPYSPPETEEPEIDQDKAGPEGGLPLRWRSRLEAELLPEEQLLWVGRANPQLIRKSLKSCLTAALVIVGIILGLLFVTGDHLSFPALFIALPVILGLTGLVLGVYYFVILNTTYAVTNRRAMQVRGLRPGSTSRTVEFYPHLRPESVTTDDTFTRSISPDYTDLILFREVSRPNDNSAAKKVEFSTIPKYEAELVKDLLRQTYRPTSKEIPRKSFGDLNPVPRPSSFESTPRKRRKHKG